MIEGCVSPKVMLFSHIWGELCLSTKLGLGNMVSTFCNWFDKMAVEPSGSARVLAFKGGRCFQQQPNQKWLRFLSSSFFLGVNSAGLGKNEAPMRKRHHVGRRCFWSFGALGFAWGLVWLGEELRFHTPGFTQFLAIGQG